MAHTTHADNKNAGRREIWRVTIILSVLTLIELGIGYFMIGMDESFFRTFLKGVIIVLMMAKAFYIVAYFMHLGHELRNMIMTIVVPLGLFIWFIIAFLYDGHSYKELRNNYDRGFQERTTEKAAPAPEHGSHQKTEEHKPAVESEGQGH